MENYNSKHFTKKNFILKKDRSVDYHITKILLFGRDVQWAHYFILFLHI